MFEFELQRFDGEAADQGESAEVQPQESGEAEPLPEELNGLPEDIARETLAEWKATQAQEAPQEPAAQQPAQEMPRPQTEESVPYVRFKEKVDEANQLKAQLAEYQRLMQQRQPVPQPPPPQPQPAPQQARITPEIAQKINAAITAEALAISNLTQKDVEEIQFVDDDDDARLVQWNQAKAVAQDRVFTALKEAQINRQRQAQQFFVAQQAAAQFCNDFAQKEMETEPNVQAIQNFAANEFFEQLSPVEKEIVAGSYGRVNQNIASPADMFTVKNYYERAKAVFLSRANSAKKQAQTPAQNSQQAANLPRSDQLKGGAEQAGGQLTATEIEKLLEGDFTKLDPKKQNLLLGLS